MKRFIAAMAALTLSLGCYAQDMIVKKDGSIIQAKVSEIGTSEVKYKKWSNQDGPSYAIAKSDILAITYQNGEKETFENASFETPSNDNSAHTPKLVSKKISPNNAALIAKYGKSHHSTIKAKSKAAAEGLGIFAFDENSVIANEDIEMTFVPASTATSPEKSGGNGSKPMYGNLFLRGRYCVSIKNNTDKTVYVDLASCSRTNEKRNETVSFYDPEIVSVTTGSSSGTAFNLGGVTGALGVGGAIGSLASATTVAGGSSSSLQRTFSQKQVVTIPPHGSRKITDFKLVAAEKGSRFKFGEIIQVQKGEELIFGSYNLGSIHNVFAIEYHPSGIKKGEINIGETKRYSIEDTPIIYDYTITYSTDPTFAEYSTLTPKIYLKEIHGQKSTYMNGIYYWLTDDASKPLEALPDMDMYTILAPIVFEK